jgi:non-specific serine/threonine protein kinase
MGGVGKTRLALAVAHRLKRAFADGVWLAELAELGGSELLPVTILHAIAPGQIGEATRELADFIGSKQLLLLLDNCEHLGPAPARLADQLLRACPNIRILATSRAPLHLTGEMLFEVPPLSVPEQCGALTTEDAYRYESVALFCERASAIAPWFVVTDEVLPKIASLCRRLDGLPLALELAAMGMRTMSLDELLARYADYYKLLTRGSPAVPARHQTLRAAVNWSYDLCTEHERILWARLSVFSGGIDLRAAEQASEYAQIATDEVLAMLGELVDKSIVSFDGAQYRMLETIRQYGLEKLEERGETQQMRGRHCAYVAGLAGRVEAAWFSRDQPSVLAEARRNLANIRSALDFCVSTQGSAPGTGLKIAASLWIHWITCGLLREGRRWLDRLLLADAEPTAERVAAMWVNGYLALIAGEIPTGLDQLDLCIELARQLGDQAGLAHATHVRGLARLLRDDVPEAIAGLEEGVALERQLAESNPYLALALTSLGAALCYEDRVGHAVEVFTEAGAMCAERGELWLQSWSVLYLGLAEWIRGRPGQAVSLWREALTMKWELADVVGSAHAIEFLAWAALDKGEAERAASLLSVSQRLFEPLSVHLVGFERLRLWSAQCAAEVRGQLGDQAFSAAMQAGRHLEPDEAVAIALGERKMPAQSTLVAPTEWAALTRREREIAERVAAGRTNREIAQELVISQRTVESHVEHILAKLGMTTRTKLAVLLAGRPVPAEDRQGNEN